MQGAVLPMLLRLQDTFSAISSCRGETELKAQIWVQFCRGNTFNWRLHKLLRTQSSYIIALALYLQKHLFQRPLKAFQKVAYGMVFIL